MGRIITLDSEIVIIAAGGHTPLDRGRERTFQMIQDHMGRGDDIYIPAPAFAECCHSIEDEFLQQLRVQPFGASAAVLSNRITSAMVEAGRQDLSSSLRTPTRQELKVDAMILATAEALGAHVLYVGADTWFARARERAGLRVEVRELPPFEPQQSSLLEDN